MGASPVSLFYCLSQPMRTHLEQEKKAEAFHRHLLSSIRAQELQLLADSLTRTVLMLARQGVENYLRLQQQEDASLLEGPRPI